MAEVLPWWRADQMEEEEEEKKKGKGKEKAVLEEEAEWRCRRHSLRSPSGVCSACLRDRLLCLCPDCHSLRPCGCSPSSSSSSSSSSSEAAGSSGTGRWTAGGEAGLGPVGPVSLLIESEPAFRRSRSMGLSHLPTTGDDPTSRSRRQSRGRAWTSLWPFSRSAEAGRKEPLPPSASGLFRSRTVAAGRSSMRGGVREEERRKEWWRWRFSSLVALLRHRKKAAPEHLLLRRRWGLVQGRK
ncbi:uncharacterized protein LOC122036516 [Zingiber officinale]|uniref:uncharacterized protein LOC122036516 n=1 Tax=Zingiber officinale TaxID=94328 RepID=UPI001C4CFA21|nr:uncharacterized protein LOC122036516 [Zingiber officinale]